MLWFRPAFVPGATLDLVFYAAKHCSRFGCFHLIFPLSSRSLPLVLFCTGLLWSEVTPENLLLLDADGNVLEGTGEAEITATMVLY